MRDWLWSCRSSATASPTIRTHTTSRLSVPPPAAGGRVQQARVLLLVVRAVRESGGTALTVTDDQMVKSVRDMARFEGIFPAPEGGATLAALEKLLDSGEVNPDDRVVLLNTGSALKYLDVLGPALGL